MPLPLEVRGQGGRSAGEGSLPLCGTSSSQCGEGPGAGLKADWAPPTPTLCRAHPLSHPLMRLTEVWPGWPSGPQSDMSHDLIQSEAMDKAEVKGQRLPRARGPAPQRCRRGRGVPQRARTPSPSSGPPWEGPDSIPVSGSNVGRCLACPLLGR